MSQIWRSRFLCLDILSRQRTYDNISTSLVHHRSLEKWTGPTLSTPSWCSFRHKKWIHASHLLSSSYHAHGKLLHVHAWRSRVVHMKGHPGRWRRTERRRGRVTVETGAATSMHVVAGYAGLGKREGQSRTAAPHRFFIRKPEKYVVGLRRGVLLCPATYRFLYLPIIFEMYTPCRPCHAGFQWHACHMSNTWRWSTISLVSDPCHSKRQKNHGVCIELVFIFSVKTTWRCSQRSVWGCGAWNSEDLIMSSDM